MPEPIDRDRAANGRAGKDIAAAVLSLFGRASSQLAILIAAGDPASEVGPMATEAVAALDLDWSAIIPPVAETLGQVYADAGVEGLKQVGIDVPEALAGFRPDFTGDLPAITSPATSVLDRVPFEAKIPFAPADVLAAPSFAPPVAGAVTGDVPTASVGVSVDLVNKEGVEYALNRAAELVGKRSIGGVLVDNPNAQWAITESTRDTLRGLVTKAMREGWSNERLAGEIATSASFSKDRAMLIARTETAFADARGNLASWIASGVVTGKAWRLAQDHDEDDACDLNADAGVVPLDEPFPSGDRRRRCRHHLRCRHCPGRWHFRSRRH